MQGAGEAERRRRGGGHTMKSLFHLKDCRCPSLRRSSSLQNYNRSTFSQFFFCSFVSFHWVTRFMCSFSPCAHFAFLILLMFLLPPSVLPPLLPTAGAHPFGISGQSQHFQPVFLLLIREFSLVHTFHVLIFTICSITLSPIGRETDWSSACC